MMDPIAHAEMTRAAGLLADPDVEITMQTTDDPAVFKMMLIRRRGQSNERGFRYRDPDCA